MTVAEATPPALFYSVNIRSHSTLALTRRGIGEPALNPPSRLRPGVGILILILILTVRKPAGIQAKKDRALA